MNIALQDKLGFSNSVIVSRRRLWAKLHASLRHTDALSRPLPRHRADPGRPERRGVRAARKLGVRGMRVFSASRGGVLPTIAERIAARAHEHGWHVQFYPHGADITEFADKLLALPNTIVLDHFASVKAEQGLDQPGFKTLLRMLDSGRVWIKLSGPMRCPQGDWPYPAVTPMARALVAHRPDRLVFGTDWPQSTWTAATCRTTATWST